MCVLLCIDGFNKFDSSVFLKSQLLCILHFVVRMSFALLPAYLELDCDPSFLAWRPSIVRIKNFARVFIMIMILGDDQNYFASSFDRLPRQLKIVMMMTTFLPPRQT